MSGGNAVSGEDDEAAAGKGMGAMGILVSGQGANKHHAAATACRPLAVLPRNLHRPPPNAISFPDDLQEHNSIRLTC